MTNALLIWSRGVKYHVIFRGGPHDGAERIIEIRPGENVLHVPDPVALSSIEESARGEVSFPSTIYRLYRTNQPQTMIADATRPGHLP